MTQFESAMDSIIVQGKVMDGVMNKNQDVGQDQAVDSMMDQLRQEMNNQVIIMLHQHCRFRMISMPTTRIYSMSCLNHNNKSNNKTTWILTKSDICIQVEIIY